MEKLKLKYVKITFKDGIIKLFGGIGNVEHIETIANRTTFKLIIHYILLDNELYRSETVAYSIDDILEIEQRWL